MLKLFVHVECDECHQRFLFGRESAYTTDALSFNTSALTAMLPHYHWRLVKTEGTRYHYCPECCYDFDDMQDQLAPGS
jgi:hypothetical protein